MLQRFSIDAIQIEVDSITHRPPEVAPESVETHHDPNLGILRMSRPHTEGMSRRQRKMLRCLSLCRHGREIQGVCIYRQDQQPLATPHPARLHQEPRQSNKKTDYKSIPSLPARPDCAPPCPAWTPSRRPPKSKLTTACDPTERRIPRVTPPIDVPPGITNALRPFPARRRRYVR